MNAMSQPTYPGITPIIRLVKLCPYALMPLRLCLYNLEALGNHFLDIFVIMLQQAQRVRSVVPLPLVLRMR